MKLHVFSTAVAVAIAVSLAGMRSAEAKIVYESELVGSPQVVYRDPVADLNGYGAEHAEAPVHSELVRRQRMRAELRNDDILTQKLEELRLKEEMARTQSLMVSGVDKTDTTLLQPSQVAQPLPEQKVGVAAVAADAQTAAKVDVKKEDSDGSESRVSITPRGGLSGIMSNMYDIQSQYAFGLSLGADLSDFIAFQAGYTYSSYLLSAGNSVYNFSYNSLQRLQMNDNVFDVGLKGYFLRPKAKLRPFIGAGAGYRRGFVNYDESTMRSLRNFGYNNTDDIELSAILGYVEAGIDFKISNMIAITGMARYFNVFSSRQTNPVNPYAFVNPGVGYPNAGYGGYGYTNNSREAAGTALSDSNFYQMMLGLTVSF